MYSSDLILSFDVGNLFVSDACKGIGKKTSKACMVLHNIKLKKLIKRKTTYIQCLDGIIVDYEHSQCCLF